MNTLSSIYACAILKILCKLQPTERLTHHELFLALTESGRLHTTSPDYVDNLDTAINFLLNMHFIEYEVASDSFKVK